MSKTQEALKLALEALEQHGCPWVRHEKPYNEAITAIREALAEPNHEYERGFVDGMQKQMQSSVDRAVNRMAEQPAQQQPVAWVQELTNLLCRIHRDGGHYIAEHGLRKAIDDADLRVAEINAWKDTAPPRREWVGLTEEDRLDIWKKSSSIDGAINATATKLREKNA